MEKEVTNQIGLIYGEGIGREILELIEEKLPNLESSIQIFSLNENILRSNLDTLISFSKDLLERNIDIVSGPINGELIYEFRKNLDLFLKKVPIYCLNPKISFPNPHDIDILILRENSSGIFNGDSGVKKEKNKTSVYKIVSYDIEYIEKIAGSVRELALNRKRKVCFFSKNAGFGKVHDQFIRSFNNRFQNEIEFRILNFDFGFADLISNPHSYDIVFTYDFVGDVITDAMSDLFLGSRNWGYSININKNGNGIYQTISGSAKDIAFLNKADPIGYLRIILELGNIFSFKNNNKLKTNIYQLIENQQLNNLSTKEKIEYAFSF